MRQFGSSTASPVRIFAMPTSAAATIAAAAPSQTSVRASPLIAGG